jgi:hypothetical protein
MTDTTTKSRPSHRLFNVTGDGENARWTDIGVAWSTKDGKGFTLALNAIPVNGRIVMRINEDKPNAKKKGS